MTAMNSPVPSPKYMPRGLLRKVCAIKRCAELAQLEHHLLCPKHEAMIPDHLAAEVETANRAFFDAAHDGDITSAMRALERALMGERKIRLAIEAKEAEAREAGDV